MGNYWLFSERSLDIRNDKKKHILDKLFYNSPITKENNQNAIIENINSIVDKLLVKKNFTSSKAKITRYSGNYFINSVFAMSDLISVKKLFAIVIFFVLLFAVIASATSFVDSDDQTYNLTGTIVEDSTLNNSTFPNNETINDSSGNLTGIDNILSNQSANYSLPSSNITYFNESQNESVVFYGLNLSIWTDKDVYDVNESVFISGLVTYNNSLINTTVNLSIIGSCYNSSMSLDVKNGMFGYEFIPIIDCSLTTTAEISYLNESVKQEIGFDVLSKPVENITLNVTDLHIWDDTDNQERYIGDQVMFYADYSSDNVSILNASCYISFELGDWTILESMDYIDGLYVYSRSFNLTGSFRYQVWSSAFGFENKTAFDSFIISQVKDEDIKVTIDDSKEKEFVYVLPGTSFYVERTVNGSDNLSVIFAPLFSEGLTIERIEVLKLDNSGNKILDIIKDNTPNKFIAGKGKTAVEKKIDNLRERLPANVKNLDLVSYSKEFTLNSPLTVRIWFKAPSWEEIITGIAPSSGKISYLTFSDESFDFESSTWWNSNWGKRKLITINSSQIEEDLTNFPILVNITDSDLANYAQDDGDDIAFVLYSDNTTKLNHEIELFNGATGNLIAWVNITSLSSSSDTKIWMFYNNSICSSQQNVEGTWNDDYVMIQHLNETSGNHLDSSSSNNDATATSVSTQGGNIGMIDGADDFDDTNTDYVTLTTSGMTTSSGSVSLWGNMDASTGTRSYFFEHRTGSNNNRIYIYEQSGTLYVGFADVFTNNIGYTITPDTWHYYTLTWSGANWYIYVDGRLEGNGGSAVLSGIDANCYLGSFAATQEWFDGIIDEVRISNIPRNTSWINTCHNTMRNKTTFLSISSEENITKTSVDSISPYSISYSPFTLTATGVDELDNVTLWYRYSSDNSSWNDWTENITDGVSPWSWNFNFSNGTGYYEFYSIGKISGFSDETAPSSADAICYFNSSINTPPTIDLITPSPNGTTGMNTLPLCQIWANDSDSSTLDVYWFENSSGSYILRNTNNSINANTTVSYTFTEFSNYSTTYWWKVAVNDSEDNISSIYYFITTSIETSVDTISPYNISSSPLSLSATGPSDLDNVTLWYRWSKDNSTWGSRSVSIFEDFESGSQNTSLWSVYQTPAGDARIQWNYGTAHGGSYSCSMDDFDTDTGDYALNVIYTNYDFTGATDINIDFWEREWGDEPNDAPDSWTGWGNYDAVAFTNDGNTWYEIVPESSLNVGAFTNFQYNISADPDFSSPPASSFAIAFQQYDNYQLTNDGRAWDDIYINFTVSDEVNGTDWIEWNDISNPDGGSPWGWGFDFPNGTGYYEFYSVGNKSGSPDEIAPGSADAICNFVPPTRPIVVTNLSSGVEETNATLWGYLSSDGGVETTCGFRYGISPGVYSENFSVGIVSNTTEFSNNNLSLTQGQIYYYQAWAENSVGFANGSELTFLTKPEAPTGLTAQSNSTSLIYLNWTTGTGYNNTYIERNASGASVWDRGEGIVIYNGSGTNFEDSGLSEGITYYYQAWSYANWSYDSTTLFQWSDANGSTNIITHDRPKIDLVNPSPNGTTGITTLPMCQIWANDSDSSTLDVYWFENSTGSYILRNTNNSVSANSIVSYTFTEFSNYSATYYWKVAVNDSTYNTTKWFNFSTHVIDTSIDTIVPYIVTYSPYNLTVSGYSDLDKVTLFYQYSIDNISWSGWMQNVTDTLSPWKWSFTFSNGTGYYEFYSLGNKTGSPNETVPGSADAICNYNVSVNNPPTQSNEYPANQSTGIAHTPQLSVTVDDGDLDTLNATWWSNSSGSWIQFGSNLSIDTSSGSVNIVQTNSNFSDYGTIYWWSLNLTDEKVWTNETYYFTTALIDTSVDTITPYIIENITPLSLSATGPSDLDNVTLWYRWSDDNVSWGHSGETVYDTPDFDSFATETENAGTTSMSWSHTVGSGLSNSILIVGVNLEDDDAGDNYFVSSADFNGDALVVAERAAADEGFTAISEIWYLLSPDAGSHTITVNFSVAINNAFGGSVSFSNVSQSFPDDISNSTDIGTPSSISTSATTVTPNSLIVAVSTDGNSGFTYSYGSEEIEIYNIDGSTHHGVGTYRIPSSAGSFTMYANLSGGTNRMSQAVAAWSPSSTVWGNGSDWMVWSNASNPDSGYPWDWGFDFPNGTGYYEFYSIGNKSDSPDETAPINADAICYLIENTTIEIIPPQWNIGTITIGSYVNTTGNYFKLLNNGTVPLIIQIKASNATNITTGAQWNLTLIPGFNNFSLQYNKSADVSWTNVNLTYDTFITNLATSSWQVFDLKLIMATTSTNGDPLALTVTFRSVAS